MLQDSQVVQRPLCERFAGQRGYFLEHLQQHLGNGWCGDLNKNGFHRLVDLNAWSQGVAFFESVRKSSLLEEVCH